MNRFKEVRDFYVKNNLKVFPITPNDKTPMASISWKVIASSNVCDVMDWFEQVPDINIGMPANLNNLFVIDIDNHDVNGVENFKKLMEKLDLKHEDVNTLIQKTPSGGYHLIFKSDEDLMKVKNVAGAFKVDGFDGIDIRTEGYICVYPSIRDNKMYSYTEGITSDNFIDSIKTMPETLKNYVLECNGKNEINDDEKFMTGDFYKEGKVVNKGERDDEIFKYINYLYNNTKLNYDEIVVLANTYNERCFNPSLSDRVVKYKVDTCFKKKRNSIIICKFD